MKVLLYALQDHQNGFIHRINRYRLVWWYRLGILLAGHAVTPVIRDYIVLSLPQSIDYNSFILSYLSGCEQSREYAQGTLPEGHSCLYSRS